MKTKQTMEYYSKLKYVGETWREARDRVIARRKRLALKANKSII